MKTPSKATPGSGGFFVSLHNGVNSPNACPLRTDTMGMKINLLAIGGVVGLVSFLVVQFLHAMQPLFSQVDVANQILTQALK